MTLDYDIASAGHNAQTQTITRYDTQGRVRLYHRYGSGAPALAADVKKLLAEAR